MPSVFGGIELHAVTIMADFVVVKTHSSYNMIIGQPTLNSRVTSTYHQKLKFHTEVNVGEVCGERALAHECYV